MVEQMQQAQPEYVLSSDEGAFMATLAEQSWARKPWPVPRSGRTAVVVVDMINGFCTEGPLASARIQGIVPNILQALTRVEEQAAGMLPLSVATLRDSHNEYTPEFLSFPPHALITSSESDLISELTTMLTDERFDVIDITKNSTSPFFNMTRGLAASAFLEWLNHQTAAGVTNFVVMGNCTDLCVYQAAMGIRLWLNAWSNVERHDFNVIVPENCVQTYDLPVDVAKKIGGVAHNGDLLHELFLYHMALNGIIVASEVV